MRLESQSIFCKQCTGTLLLHGIAVEGRGELDGRRRLDTNGGVGSEVGGSSRTEVDMISNEP